MKQAWFMEDSEEDQRLPHHRNPKQFVLWTIWQVFLSPSLLSLLLTFSLYISLFQLDCGFYRFGSVILEIEP